MKKKGFTLVELLVVIAIVALLMAILIPALSKARRQAQDVVCRAHLRSWGVAFACYGSNWDDKVAPACTWATIGGEFAQWSWVEILRPYYKYDKIRFCPSAKKIGTEMYKGCKVGSKFAAWQIPMREPIPPREGSYGMNGFAQYVPETQLVGPWNTPKEDHWGKMNIKNAREIPLLGDCIWREAYSSNQDQPIATEDAPFSPDRDYGVGIGNGQINRYLIDRHNKAVNLLCLDGSVPHVSLPDLWQFRWCRTFEKKKVTIRWLR